MLDKQQINIFVCTTRREHATDSYPKNKMGHIALTPIPPCPVSALLHRGMHVLWCRACLCDAVSGGRPPRKALIGVSRGVRGAGGLYRVP